MKRSLGVALNKFQLYCVIVTLITLGLAGYFIWTHTIKLYKEQLYDITQLVQKEVQQSPDVLVSEDPIIPAMKKKLLPVFEKISSFLPGEFTVGFYSVFPGPITTIVSQGKTFEIPGVVIPLNNKDRASWLKKKPIYRIARTTFYPYWVLYCDTPLMLNSQVTGHIFAYINLSGLFSTFAHLGLVVMVICIITGLIMIILRVRLKNKLQFNLDQLLLQNRTAELPPFDYDEFAVVAALNHKTHKQIMDIFEKITWATLNSISDGVIVTDSDGKIIFLNRNAETLTAWTRDDSFGAPLEKVFYVMDHRTSEPYTHITRRVLEVQKTIPLLNAVLVNKELLEISLVAHCAPIITDTKEPFGVVIVFQDVTEKQKIETELLKAEKLESLGILAGGIAHDFNNNLSAILGNLQLASLKLSKGKDIRKYLTDTIETVYKASDLTKQLLTFSRGGAPVKKAAALANLIQDTSQFALRGSKVKLHTKLPEDLWPVEIDTGQISQVIHNLIINAKQAMPKGGVITVAAGNLVIEPGERLNPGRYVKISVNDEGDGIPAEILGKIFDPFFTTKKEGTGLGLATSYSIIRQHEGYIEVESKVGQGTTFFIYLPTTLPDMAALNIVRETTKSAEGAKILLMDDENSILQVIGEMLRDLGYQVTLALDGTEAITFFLEAFESGEPFDVTIMDLTIPGGLGGQEAVAILRDIDPEIKAVVSSGYANDPIMSDYERYGFSGVVTKPYKIDELNVVLQKVITKKIT